MNSAGYKLGIDERGERFIACTSCGMVSYHPVDIRELYCGRCREFHNRPEPRCDFCGSFQPVVRFRCRDIEFPEHGIRSVGAWLACQDCAGCIDAGDRESLLRHTLDVYSLRFHLTADQVQANLEKYQRAFFAARTDQPPEQLKPEGVHG